MESIFDILNIEVKDNYFMACIWPIAESEKAEAAENTLRQIGKLIYAKDVTLTYLGMKNFMTQIYGHQEWTGTIHNQFRGAFSKVDACYQAGKPVKTYVLEAPSLDIVLNAKEKIRKIYDVGKHSIHISDHAKETYDMIQLLYNKNSVDFLNYAHPHRYKSVYSYTKSARKLIQERKLEEKRFILGMDAVLEVCGLRKAQVLEVITDYPSNDLAGLDRSINVNHSAEVYGLPLSELLYHAENYLYFEGMKFVSPSCILKAQPAAVDGKTKDMLERFVKQTQSGAEPYPEYKMRLRRMRAGSLQKIKKLIYGARK